MNLKSYLEPEGVFTGLLCTKMLQQSFLMLPNLPHGTYPSHDTFVLSEQLRQPH